jgi:hypothetical protein
VSLSAGLPPVLVPPTAGGAGLELALGEVAFEVGLEGVRTGATAHARGRLSVRLAVAGLERAADGTVRPVLAGEPEVAVEVDEVDWRPGPEAREQAAALLEALVRSRLGGALAGALGGVAVPAADLSPLDPALDGLALGLGAPSLRLEGAWLVVAGSPAVRP